MGRKPAAVDPRVAAAQEKLSALIVEFCRIYLNSECQKLCVKLLATWAKHDPDALLRGKPEVSAAAVVHTIASLNELFYRDSRPSVAATEIAAHFGVSTGGVNTRVNALKQTMQASGVPVEQYLTKRGKEHRETIESLFDELLGAAPLLQNLRDFDGVASVDKDGAFYDAERPVMHAFYDLMAEHDDDEPSEALIAGLRQLIAQDPDFYDSYSALGELLGGDEGRELFRDACTRALGRIRSNTFIRHVPWGYLENRHLLRAILNEALECWDDQSLENAVFLLKTLLELCPDDNVGARQYLLAIREGMTFVSFEERFMDPSGLGYTAGKLHHWFGSKSQAYPDDFAEWQKYVDSHS